MNIQEHSATHSRIFYAQSSQTPKIMAACILMIQTLFLKFHFNIILTSTPNFLKHSLPFRL